MYMENLESRCDRCGERIDTGLVENFHGTKKTMTSQNSVREGIKTTTTTHYTYSNLNPFRFVICEKCINIGDKKEHQRWRVEGLV